MPRALVPVFAVVFLDVLGLTILVPLLPALAARTGASAAPMGLAISLTALCAALSSPLWGALSDRIGRKRVLQCSQGFSLAGYVMLAFAGSLPALLASRAIEGLGGGNIGVAQSLIADLTAPAERERAFAYGAAAFGAGFVVGPVLAGQLLRFGIATPFVVAAMLQALCFALTSRYVPDTRAPRSARATPPLGHVLANAEVRRVLARQGLYILAYTYFFTIFSLYLDREQHVPSETSSLLLGLAGAIGAGTQLGLAARLERRLGDERLAQNAFALATLAYVALGFVDGRVWLFLVVLVPWAASGALLQPTLAKQLAAAAPDEARGAVLGAGDALDNAAMIVSPFVAATVLERLPLAIGVVPALALGLAFALGQRRPR